MPRHTEGNSAHSIHLEFLKADLDAAMALVRLAFSAHEAGECRSAAAIVREAARLIVDTDRLVPRLNPRESFELAPRIDALRRAIRTMETAAAN